MKFTESSDLNPIAFFIDYIEDGKIHQHYREFCSSCYQEMKMNPESVSVIETDSDCIMHVKTQSTVGFYDIGINSKGKVGLNDSEALYETYSKICYTDKLNFLMNSQTRKSKTLITDQYRDIINNQGNPHSFLNLHRVLLSDMVTQNPELFNRYPVLRKINELIKLIDKLTKGSGIIRKLSYVKTPQPGINDTFTVPTAIEPFFGGKISVKKLKELYGYFIDYEIFEETEFFEDGENAFIQIFSSPAPNMQGSSLWFKVDNHDVVSVFQVLQECFFPNLTPTNIGKGSCFLTKKKKLFCKGDIYTAKSNRNKKLKAQKLHINANVDEFIQKIKNLA